MTAAMNRSQEEAGAAKSPTVLFRVVRLMRMLKLARVLKVSPLSLLHLRHLLHLLHLPRPTRLQPYALLPCTAFRSSAETHQSITSVPACPHHASAAHTILVALTQLGGGGCSAHLCGRVRRRRPKFCSVTSSTS